MTTHKAKNYISSFLDSHTYNVTNNLAARWGLVWSLFFVILSISCHYLHDYSFLYPKSHLIHWLVSLLPLVFYPIVGATGTLEIRENQETVEKLKWCSMRYKTLVENLPDIVYSSSPDDKFDIQFISKHIEYLTGYKAEEFYVSTKKFIEVIHPDDRESIIKKTKGINQSIQLNYRIIHKGTKKCYYVIDHSLPVKENDKIIAIEGIIIDVTNEIKAKERLKALTKELIKAQEVERERIAKELHDEAGQALSMVKINLNFLEKNINHDGTRARNLIRKTDKIIDSLIVELKRISLDLRPSMLDYLGLESTLRWYIKEFKRTTKMDVMYTISGFEKRLPIDTEIAFYRIVQEALTNIVKHSLADRVKIEIKEEDKKITLCIEDNGQGFSVEKAFNPDTSGISFGIIGMQERVKNLGGDFEITSEKGNGTRLAMHVPL